VLSPTRFKSSPTFKVVDTVRLVSNDSLPEASERLVQANEWSFTTNEWQRRPFSSSTAIMGENTALAEICRSAGGIGPLPFVLRAATSVGQKMLFIGL